MSGVTAEAGRILLKRNSDPVQIVLVQIIRKKQENPEIGKEPFCGGIRLPPQWRLFWQKRAAYAFSGIYTGQQESDAGFLP